MEFSDIKTILKNRNECLDLGFSTSDLYKFTSYITETYEDISINFNFDNFLINILLVRMLNKQWGLKK